MSVTTITPDQYCDNPADYKNLQSLSNETRAYWDSYCTARLKKPPANFPNSGMLSKMNSDVLVMFLNGMLSPEGLEMMGMIMGGVISLKLVKASIGNFIKNGLSEIELKAAEDFIAKGGDAYAANGSSIFSKVMGDSAYIDPAVLQEAEKASEKAVAEGVIEEGSFFAGKYAIGMALEFIEWGNEVLMGIQMLGMVLDLWDPCNLNAQLDANTVATFTKIYNDVFRHTWLIGSESRRDTYGKISVNTLWPVEYYADQSALIPVLEDKYKPIRIQYMAMYINNLTYNSEGVLIAPVLSGTPTELIKNSTIQNLELTALGILSIRNTVVENWLLKWWPIPVGILFFIIILLFFIKKNGRG